MALELLEYEPDTSEAAEADIFEVDVGADLLPPMMTSPLEMKAVEADGSDKVFPELV